MNKTEQNSKVNKTKKKENTRYRNRDSEKYLMKLFFYFSKNQTLKIESGFSTVPPFWVFWALVFFFIFSSHALVRHFSSWLHLYEWGHTLQDWTTEPCLSSGYDITIRVAVIPALATITAILVISISLNPGHMAANAHCSAFPVLSPLIQKHCLFLFSRQNPRDMSIQSAYVMQQTQICCRKYRTDFEIQQPGF